MKSNPAALGGRSNRSSPKRHHPRLATAPNRLFANPPMPHKSSSNRSQTRLSPAVTIRNQIPARTAIISVFGAHVCSSRHLVANGNGGRPGGNWQHIISMKSALSAPSSWPLARPSSGSQGFLPYQASIITSHTECLTGSTGSRISSVAFALLQLPFATC